MTITLTVEDRVRLVDALIEGLEIARYYRREIADEDSIILLQDLEEAVRILGIEIPEGPA